ncbi:hypothetical protein TNCV_2701101 [Trichonephila clavipes]|nr:hypothetical protein TNCV_2701101 [Trichonephila clavipes]
MASGLSWASVSHTSQTTACLDIVHRKRSQALRGQETKEKRGEGRRETKALKRRARGITGKNHEWWRESDKRIRCGITSESCSSEVAKVVVRGPLVVHEEISMVSRKMWNILTHHVKFCFKMH